jgi:hypothetical protein
MWQSSPESTPEIAESGLAVNIHKYKYNVKLKYERRNFNAKSDYKKVHR